MASSAPSLVVAPTSPAASSSSSLVEPPLTKPTLPKRPRPPDLRYVKDEAVKAARLQAHVVELVAYDELKQRYDEELYPAYHAKQQRHGAREAYVAQKQKRLVEGRLKTQRYQKQQGEARREALRLGIEAPPGPPTLRAMGGGVLPEGVSNEHARESIGFGASVGRSTGQASHG